jgi:uncharacterized protein YqjF (DUF2071 family)
MTWVDLAFLHWRVPAALLRPLVPSQLELDVFDGFAWVAVTPFRMTRVRPVLAPPIPGTSDFPELNVRTYVRHGARAGVWFFSLDAASWLAVATARAVTGLPYFHARMQQDRTGDEVRYGSTRTHPGAPAATLRATYRPTGPVYASKPGSLDHWLTERYSLFVRRAGTLLRLDIEHVPWPLQPGTCEVQENTMAAAGGIALPRDAPHVLYAARLDVVAHWPHRV